MDHQNRMGAKFTTSSDGLGDLELDAPTRRSAVCAFPTRCNSARERQDYQLGNRDGPTLETDWRIVAGW
jgi:hypothetical protein